MKIRNRFVNITKTFHILSRKAPNYFFYYVFYCKFSIFTFRKHFIRLVFFQFYTIIYVYTFIKWLKYMNNIFCICTYICLRYKWPVEIRSNIKPLNSIARVSSQREKLLCRRKIKISTATGLKIYCKRYQKND